MAQKTVPKIRWSVANNLTGRYFGQLFVIGPTGQRSNACLLWRCLCACGKDVFVKSTSLVSGHTKSCGCWNLQRHVTHGAARHGHEPREYFVWASMLARCQTPTHRAFPRYGGRGITVCERWKRFEHFIADMGPCPKGLTLERLDNDKGYGPDNCKWATRAEQRRNTSKNHLLTLNGITLCKMDWCHKTGLRWGTLSGRLRRGWSVERSLTTQSAKKRP